MATDEFQRGACIIRLPNDVVQTSGAAPYHVILAGTAVWTFDAAGSFALGPNEWINPASTNMNDSAPDDLYHAKTRRRFGRSLMLTEVGDPPDLALSRFGPDNNYPGPVGGYAALAGVTSGTTLGTMYWRGAATPNGGTPGVTAGATLQGRSAQIYARAAQDVFAGKTGGHLYISTTPIDAGSNVDRVCVRANGAVGVLSASTAETALDTLSRGDLLTGGKTLAVGGLGVGNSAAATTPGSVVKKTQVFDATTGASLGYIAIYGAIT